MGKRDQPASRGRNPGTTVCVSGISSDVKKVQLQEKFGDFGRIVRIEVPSGKAIAFIEFEDAGDAATAKRQTDGTTMGRNRIGCKLADDRSSEFKPREFREPLGGGGKYPDRIGRGFRDAKPYIEEWSSKSSLRSTAATHGKSAEDGAEKENTRKSRSPVSKGRSPGGKRDSGKSTRSRSPVKKGRSPSRSHKPRRSRSRSARRKDRGKKNSRQRSRSKKDSRRPRSQDSNRRDGKKRSRQHGGSKKNIQRSRSQELDDRNGHGKKESRRRSSSKKKTRRSRSQESNRSKRSRHKSSSKKSNRNKDKSTNGGRGKEKVKRIVQHASDESESGSDSNVPLQ
eukprot:gnl/MRDRNA2_/MRDRNA2_76136_c0_seq1.p1 gnl/MRDRNA2_/MRDRNA2_76136_c0~~gnl/MRDRNA2_/MRDRNA2_76136_c0_seq1.p1  ORF type:complete len:340 (+),score=66.66 gnl/MRDRNA2_/MRDRNA2_76136_c0_seq1:110-1129(+)